MKQKTTWDYFSDQPKVMNKANKRQLRKNNLYPNIKLLITNIFYFPYLLIKFIYSKQHKINIDNSLFYGLCVNLDKGDIQHKLVEELGVKSLQIRVYLSDIDNIDAYVDFVKKFGVDKTILINIIQNTNHINDHQLLRNDVMIIFNKFKHLCNEFIIGNAVNRIKWGFSCMDEYLRFFQVIQQLRDEKYLDICLIGTSIIDFEYHYTIRVLFNHYPIYFDKIASLLYVDRRGKPQNKQYGIFDLKNKINFLHTIVSTSKQSNNEIYISEANYPLSNTAHYAPTSESDCVDENTYAKYMLDYFNIAKNTHNISRIYWHQLIAPGYGLVDNREGEIRKTPSFNAFKKQLSQKL